MVLTNGLAPTLAFIEVKASGKGSQQRAAQEILAHLKSALAEDFELERNWLSSVLEADTPIYRAMTREVIELSIWHKRFAVGVLGVTADQADLDAGQTE